MRRILVVIAAIALMGSTLAFAPAVTVEQEAETDHQVTFSEDGSETIVGGAPGGINLTGYAEDELRCSADPDAYCETILVTIEQPVADENPDEVDFGLGELAIDLVSNAPGGDFDLYVRESDADGTRGTQIASSGNAPACAQVCGSGVPDPVGLWYNPCDGVDECVEFSATTSEFAGTRHYLVEVVYFASPERYTAELSYTRTDGRNFDGTTPEPGEPAPTPVEPADSADRVDVTGGYEQTGDWGGGGNNAALGDALGQDIEAAFLEYADDTFTFTIDLTSLPAAGGTPEVTRYQWAFQYNDVAFELDGKFTNYSRGACDPTAGNCPPPRDPGVGYFALRGNCTETTTGNQTVTTCEELGGVTAAFDSSDGTITIPVPASTLTPEGVAACDTITAGAALFEGGPIFAAPSAFFTSTTMPHDTALHWVPLVVPPADPDLSCDA